MKFTSLSTGLSLLAGLAMAQSGGVSPTTTVPQIDYSGIENALRAGATVQAQGEIRKLGENQLDIPTFRNLYNDDLTTGCRAGSTGSVIPFPCGIPPRPALKGDYSYWEPAAIVEVSCQKGFSFMKPGFMGGGTTAGGTKAQAGQCGTGPNWFFEVRVWASSPKKWGDRMTALGGQFWQQTGGAMCSGEGTEGSGKYPWGYGIKYNFSKGPETGPANSYEAYISDRDPAWFQQLPPEQASQKLQQTQAAPNTSARCQEGSTDITACWGDPNQQNGWVTHPHRPVAAALVGYRGLMKALAANKVARPIQGGWRLSMDYPFVKSPSAHAQQMGMQSQGQTRHRGSDCFVPGEAGPWWYTTGRKGQNPPALPATLTTSATAFADTGIYIFTYWVKTGCTVYSVKGGICQDQYHY